MIAVITAYLLLTTVIMSKYRSMSNYASMRMNCVT